MKKIVPFLLIFLSLAVFSQSKSSMIKFKKDFNVLEFKVKAKTDSLNYGVTKKINKISFNLKQELNDLESKYASNDLKLAIYQNKYKKELQKVQAKRKLTFQNVLPKVSGIDYSSGK